MSRTLYAYQSCSSKRINNHQSFLRKILVRFQGDPLPKFQEVPQSGSSDVYSKILGNSYKLGSHYGL